MRPVRDMHCTLDLRITAIACSDYGIYHHGWFLGCGYLMIGVICLDTAAGVLNSWFLWWTASEFTAPQTRGI